VLLGDVLELRQGPQREALLAAKDVLQAVGAALASGTQVIIVPGNHDHRLLGPWFERRAREGARPALGAQSRVDWRAGEPLAELAGWLAPAELEVCYPGYWLREDVYAFHGHYADRHTTVPMLERLGAGAMAAIVGEGPAGPRSAEDYERVLAPLYAWLDAVAQAGGPMLGRSSHGASTQAWRALAGSGRRRSVRGRAAAAAFPVLIAALNRSRIGPLSADLSSAGLRCAGLRAIGEVLLRLGVDARHVIFGHTHRAGPLASDDRSEWRAIVGAQLTNVGSWVHEPNFLGSEPRRSPYRPGFCIKLGDDGPPKLGNLLDGARSEAEWR
jgi:hypothetical protein